MRKGGRKASSGSCPSCCQAPGGCMKMKVLRFDRNPTILTYQRNIYAEFAGLDPEQHRDRFTKWWFGAEGNDLHKVEYLLPLMTVTTEIEPFAFERRFVAQKLRVPSLTAIKRRAPWAYQIEFGSRSTLGVRNDADWKCHRHRASLLVDTAVALAGEAVGDMTVLDVGCHCGVFALEFAERGFGQVTGVDLRSENIRQAEFLRSAFAVRNAEFSVLNVRDIMQAAPADIVFCGGLLYHVTFPLELLRNMFNLTK